MEGNFKGSKQIVKGKDACEYSLTFSPFFLKLRREYPEDTGE